jgi:hypothetical protein
MAPGQLNRTIADLEHTVRAIATEFKTDSVFIIGSQAILLALPDPPPEMTISPEIDAFPANAKIWEMQEKAKHPDANPEASEQINALFGEGSLFHETHGFYIDGVDENTAVLPRDWRSRAIVRKVEVCDRVVTAVVPCPEDVIVSKLARMDEKDRRFVEAYHAVRPLDAQVIEQRIRSSRMELAVAERAVAYIQMLARKSGHRGGDGSGGGVGGGP